MRAAYINQIHLPWVQNCAEEKKLTNIDRVRRIEEPCNEMMHHGQINNCYLKTLISSGPFGMQNHHYCIVDCEQLHLLQYYT